MSELDRVIDWLMEDGFDDTGFDFVGSEQPEKLEFKKVNFSSFKGLVRGKEGIVFLGCGEEFVDESVTAILGEWRDAGFSETADPAAVLSDIYLIVDAGQERTDLAMIWKSPAPLDIGRLAMWRLRLADRIKWVSDYLDHRSSGVY